MNKMMGLLPLRLCVISSPTIFREARRKDYREGGFCRSSFSLEKTAPGVLLPQVTFFLKPRLLLETLFLRLRVYYTNPTFSS